ncbi:hypothetical protein GCM10028790_10340 [Micromonospora taraxaci]|uniref:Uncharacterized protein n=1 Tax=Micromonospora taraxaci TaxID=1316803 RepID=A0A561W8E6_9ACTN|nr:hypothetical protein FHU34_115477 [Micromonospora taraxaci]
MTAYANGVATTDEFEAAHDIAKWKNARAAETAALNAKKLAVERAKKAALGRGARYSLRSAAERGQARKRACRTPDGVCGRSSHACTRYADRCSISDTRAPVNSATSCRLRVRHGHAAPHPAQIHCGRTG